LFAVVGPDLLRRESEIELAEHHSLQRVEGAPLAFAMCDLRDDGDADFPLPMSTQVVKNAIGGLTYRRASRGVTTKLVQTIAAEVIDRGRSIFGEDVVLVPVLRGALPLWQVATERLGHPPSLFVVGSKDKTGREVDLAWIGPQGIPEGSTVVVLDTLVARGDTVVCVVEDLSGRCSRVVVCSCYAAPEGVETISRTGVMHLIGAVAQAVDGDGRVVPPTFGDIGARLFESASEAEA